MGIQELVDKYIGDIHIDDVDYIPWDDAKHDCAYLLLDIPKVFLDEYLHLKNQEEKQFPDDYYFWSDTNLRDQLRGKEPRCYHEPLGDILDFLGSKVQINYQVCSNHRIRLSIYEVPREMITE